MMADQPLARACSDKVSSLLNLCIKKVVHDHASTRSTLQCIPRELFPSFLMSAVTHKRDLSIKEIVAKWPHRVLSLKSLIPQMLEDHVCVPCSRQQDSSSNQIASLCHFIVDGFMQNDGRLQLLDITGLSNSPRRPNKGYSAVHILQYLEAKQKHITTQPQNKAVRTIHMDWTLEDNYECKKVMTLVNSLSPSILVKCKTLAFNNVSLIQLLVDVIYFVDRQILNAMDLSMHCMGFCRLIRNHMLGGMKSLTSLDLSYCQRINLYWSDPPTTLLAETFGRMPCLTQLRMNGNHIGGTVQSLLSHIQKPLLVLGLHCCKLEPSDIAYLATSHHANHLKELDLGNNCLSEDPESLLKLLTSLSASLLHLSLDTTTLDKMPASTRKLVQLSYEMKKLQTLTIGNNTYKATDLATIVTSYALNVPSLVTLEIPLYNDSTDSKTMVLCPQNPVWDNCDFTGHKLGIFLEMCIRIFRERGCSNAREDLHVTCMRKGDVAEKCYLFKF